MQRLGTWIVKYYRRRIYYLDEPTDENRVRDLHDRSAVEIHDIRKIIPPFLEVRGHDRVAVAAQEEDQLCVADHVMQPNHP
jgi:hypothetical protein